MRIRNNLVPSTNEDDERKKLDSSLKAVSQTKMRQWPDSIEMAKKNKLEVRKKVFFEKEAEKRKIDEEERKFQEMQKKIIVERANKLLFDAQDPVKSFHSKLLYADVLKERDYQKEITNRKREVQSKIDEGWLDLERQQMEAYDAKEYNKAVEEFNKKQDQIGTINQQFTDFKIKKVKEYQDRVVEGEMIKLAAKKALEEDKKKEEEIRNKCKLQQEEFKKANAELEKVKEQRKQHEKEQLKKIEEFAVKKQQLTDLRKRKEDEKFKEKQDQRQKLIDRQVQHLQQLKNREDEILDKQVKEAEEKRNRQEEEKKRRFEELKRQIDENRDLQTNRRREVREQDKKDDKEFVEYWKERMQQLELDEKEEKGEIRARNKNLQDFHKMQMEVKKKNAETEFVSDQEAAYKTKLMLNNEQDDFLKYAEESIKEYYNAGKDITPLILDLKSYKKKLFYG
jgi:hypothetical protein